MNLMAGQKSLHLEKAQKFHMGHKVYIWRWQDSAPDTTGSVTTMTTMASQPPQRIILEGI